MSPAWADLSPNNPHGAALAAPWGNCKNHVIQRAETEVFDKLEAPASFRRWRFWQNYRLIRLLGFFQLIDLSGVLLHYSF